MSKALKPADSRMGGVVFELDRFDLTAESGCLLQGRWFGVRGRRFMRPTLTLIGNLRKIRLLADLEHKPWDPEDGRPWEAVFPGAIEDRDLTAAELTVAPDITIALPVPDGGSRATKGKPASGVETLTRELAEAQREGRRAKRALAAVEAEKARTAQRLDALAAELDDVTRAYEGAQQERDQAAAERAASLRAHEAAIEEGEAARSALERALAERDGAVAAREGAVSERDAALAARDQAIAERDAAIMARDDAMSARDAALAARDDATARRDEALAARDVSTSERDAALEVRREALAERDAMKGTSERLKAELADEKTARGAALVMRRATQAHRTASAPPRLTGAVATIAVLAIVLVILIVVGVL
jgi:hypothetical protein